MILRHSASNWCSYMVGCILLAHVVVDQLKSFVDGMTAARNKMLLLPLSTAKASFIDLQEICCPSWEINNGPNKSVGRRGIPPQRTKPTDVWSQSQAMSSSKSRNFWRYECCHPFFLPPNFLPSSWIAKVSFRLPPPRCDALRLLTKSF
jgi:hypothetical protein